MTIVDPGLDVAALHALRARGNRSRERRGDRASGGDRDERLLERIEDHLETHDGYVAFSGGKDSAVVLDLARRVDPNVPAVFFDSGLEYPETLTYIRYLAARWALNLHIVAAQPSLLEVLVASGCWDHDAARAKTPNLHHTLITAPAAAAHDRFGLGELWGVRAAESRGRRTLYAAALATWRECGCCVSDTERRHTHGGRVDRRDGTSAYSPVWDWPTRAVWEYLYAHRIPINPVYDRLRVLGAPEHATRVAHLVDANQLNAGRITWLRRGWPVEYARLVAALPRLAEFV